MYKLLINIYLKIRKPKFISLGIAKRIANKENVYIFDFSNKKNKKTLKNTKKINEFFIYREIRRIHNKNPFIILIGKSNKNALNYVALFRKKNKLKVFALKNS